MLRTRTLLAAFAAAIIALSAAPISQAATHLPGYQLLWGSGHQVSLLSNGQSLATLRRGGAVSVRRGPDVLTISLRQAVPPPPAKTHPAADATPVIGTRATLHSVLQAGLLAAINADRAARKLPPLVLSVAESRCSLDHSKHMQQINLLVHDQFPTDVCIPHGAAAENIGEWSGDVMGALFAIHRFMIGEGPCPHRGCPGAEYEAHGHYLNLVNPTYTKIGIGIYVRNGVTWVTEDFTDE